MQPAPYQLSYGVVTGKAAPGTRRLIVRVGTRTLANRKLGQRRFWFRVALPLRESTVNVIGIDSRGTRSRVTVPHVFGAPRAATPRARASRNDLLLALKLKRLAASYPGTSAIYVQNLTTGVGAAWNARATFPAASTLKLAIAVTALAHTHGTPGRGTTLDRLLRLMLTYSDNEAANDTERFYAGSTSRGSALVNAMMLSIGLVDTSMYGGYTTQEIGGPARLLAGRIPLRVDSQPAWGRGKKTSAYDLASLMRAVWLASGGRGPLAAAQPGFTSADARYLLYLLAGVRDPGKLNRQVGSTPGVRVLHKAGWLNNARHDNGIVLWSRGALVVTVMTYRSAGAGVPEDVLAGKAAAVALERFRG